MTAEGGSGLGEGSGKGLGWRTAALAAAIFLFTSIVFWPATRNGFVALDDPAYVTENEHVLAGLTSQGARWALTAQAASNWHPLTWLSHMADVELFGIGPGGHHATSLLLHASNTLLLFLLLRSVTGTLWRSALVALLFAVHPLRVESVAWVAERKDVLSAFFFLLTLASYARYARRNALLPYALALGFFALGLAAKPMLVTGPFVLLLLDCWPLGRVGTARPGRLLLEKLPFFLLAAACALLTLRAQSHGGAVVALETVRLPARLANAAAAYGTYLEKTLLPTGLAAVYPLSLPVPLVRWASGLLVLLALTAVAVVSARRLPFLAVGWLWFVGMLVPVIGLVQAGGQALADRYTYLPHIGLVVGAVWTVAEVASPPGRRVASVGAALAVLFLALCTRGQVPVWRDGVALMEHSVAVTGPNPVADYHLANALSRAGRHEEARRRYGEALALAPTYAPAYLGRGSLLLVIGRPSEAAADFGRALALAPGDPRALNNLGVALSAQGNAAQAASCYREALRFDAGDSRARSNLGLALVELGETEEAAREFAAVLRADPLNGQARRALAAMGGSLPPPVTARGTSSARPPALPVQSSPRPPPPSPSGEVR